MSDDLVPHKKMLVKLGLSRTSVWRALQSRAKDFPKPVIVRRKLSWRAEDLPLIADAMKCYAGRGHFDKARRVEKLSAHAARKVRGVRQSKQRRGTKGKGQEEPALDKRQLDLFDGS